MNKEEIIRLSCEAGWPDPEGEDLEVFVKFAGLVAQHEREACAVIAETAAHKLGGYQFAADAIRMR